MVKKVFGISLLAMMGVALLVNVNNRVNHEVAKADETTVGTLANHNYFTGAIGPFGANTVTPDQHENEITYTRLNNVGGADCWWVLVEGGAKEEGEYAFSAMMRASANYNGQIAGFGFWANAPINARIFETSVSSQLVAGEWRKVTATFTFTSEQINAIDSIHFWYQETDGYIDFYDMKLCKVEGVDGILGENIFKDNGFENVDLSAGSRNGWNDRHSGVLGCPDSQVTWMKEGSGDNENQFLRLSYNGAEGEQAFSGFFSFLNNWNGAWPAGIEAGEYLVEMDVRTNNLFASNNVGFAFYSSAGARIERDLTSKVTSAPVGQWTHISYRYPNVGVELTAAYAAGVDSFQFWANSLSTVGWQLDIDNISIKKVSHPAQIYSGSFGIELQQQEWGGYWDDANANLAVYIYKDTNNGWSELIPTTAGTHNYIINYNLGFSPVGATMIVMRYAPSIKTPTWDAGAKQWAKVENIAFGELLYVFGNNEVSSINYYVGAESDSWSCSWGFTLHNVKRENGEWQVFGDIELVANDEFKMVTIIAGGAASYSNSYFAHASLASVFSVPTDNIVCAEANTYRMYYPCESKLYITTLDLAAADEYAEAFLAATAVCDATGETNKITAQIWGDQKAAFLALRSDTARGYLTNAVANDGVGATYLEQFGARYNYIVGKYGTAMFEDFAGRGAAGTLTFEELNVVEENDSSFFIIIVVCSAMVISTASILVIYKRKTRRIK